MSGRIRRRALWALLAGALALAVFGIVPAHWVLAPLLGLAILRVGIASFASLAGGAAHVPTGSPQPVDARAERVTYRCEGCGAELLLLVRGVDLPPRHCGERMAERREIPHGTHG